MNNLTLIEFINELSIERPLFIVLAFLPLLLMLFKKIKMHALTNYSEKPLWPWSINISVQYFKSRNFLKFLSWLLIAVAMTGPRLPGFNQTLSKHDKSIKSDISIMLIADINGITESEFNSYIIRLSDFVDNLNGEKIGFVALNSKSALISPLTNDYSVSYFYLKQLFNVINTKSNSNTNDLYKSINISYKEILDSKPTSGVIVYWSDYLRNKINNQTLIKVKILLEEIQGHNFKVIPIWNNSNEYELDSSDITSIFGDSSDEFSGLLLQELYDNSLEDLKTSTLFDSDKDHGYQHLFAYPLILGLIILIISFIPFQIFREVESEN